LLLFQVMRDAQCTWDLKNCSSPLTVFAEAGCGVDLLHYHTGYEVRLAFLTPTPALSPVPFPQSHAPRIAKPSPLGTIPSSRSFWVIFHRIIPMPARGMYGIPRNQEIILINWYMQSRITSGPIWSNDNGIEQRKRQQKNPSDIAIAVESDPVPPRQAFFFLFIF
jgi:hypothetical protein